jgi:PTH1 family peptidyl-tRNA hydrolase
MKYLIVGIGNKGEEYAETRHNIGFKVAEKIAEKIEALFKSSNFGLLAEGKYKGRKVFILKPDTYVNLSGNAVKFWMQKENIPLENILIITDDLALPSVL